MVFLQAPWGPGSDWRERAAEAEARAERARADAARLRRALVDAEVDLQRTAADAAGAQGALQARRPGCPLQARLRMRRALSTKQEPQLVGDA